MPDYFVRLAPKGTYHFFSRANGDEKLFREEENYSFFLQRTRKYLCPICDIFSYCLLPNQFHLLAQIKPKKALEEYWNYEKPDQPFCEEKLPGFLMKRFSNLLNSYAKSYNKLYDRKGSLFIDFLRRIEIENNKACCAALNYIHMQPVLHGHTKNVDQWKWSSLKELMARNSKLISIDAAVKRFGDLSVFMDSRGQKIAARAGALM